MFNQIRAFLSFFEAGKVVSNPETWKNRQVAVNAVTALASAGFGVARAAGVEVPSAVEDNVGVIVAGIGGFVGVFNSVATVISTDKIGFKSEK